MQTLALRLKPRVQFAQEARHSHQPHRRSGLISRSWRERGSVGEGFSRDLIRERTQAGLVAARARGRKDGRPRLRVDPKQVQAEF